MAIADTLQSLREIDFSDLNLENVGSWPVAVKILAWFFVFALCAFLGYKQFVVDLRTELAEAEKKEEALKTEFEQKAYQAANLDAYRKQMVEMEETFGALKSQLPSDTEVPGLLEDITEKGADAGLDFKSIDLQEEKSAEFYVELPISISVSGSYHDLGAFVSGVAGLPRIVTLHDFSIAPASSAGTLDMKIMAKTYRYKKEEEQ